VNAWWLPLSHRWLWGSVSVALLAGVVIGSLWPGGVRGVEDVSDKFQHTFSYFVLATWFVGLAPRRTYPWIAAGLLLLGLTMEVLQGTLTTDRAADPRDMAANSIGIGIGIVLAYVGLGAWAERVEQWLSRR
jgi:VanZ family protein